MSTKCAPLVADERDFMLSISDNNQAILLTHLTLYQDI